MFRAALLALLFLSLPFADLTAQQRTQLEVEIQGTRRVREGHLASFAAMLPDRAAQLSSEGYSPTVRSANGVVYPVWWDPSVDFVWDFGDDTPKVTVRDRSSIAHTYADDGRYTVTLEVRDADGIFATDTHEVTITNRVPSYLTFAAVEIEPDSQTVELSGSARDAAGDSLEVLWEFGDGKRRSGTDLWSVRHAYTVPGTYEAKMTVSDGDGGSESEKKKIVVRGTGKEPGTTRNAPGEVPPESEVVISRFEATLSGAVDGKVEAEVRSMSGVYMQPVRDGVCRFVFTVWDDASLAYGIAVTDLAGLPPEGARYTVRKPTFTFVLEKNQQAYVMTRDRFRGGFPLGGGGLGTTADAITRAQTDALPAGEKEKIGNRMGLELEQRDAGAAERPLASASPFPLQDKEGFEVAGGTLELTFLPGRLASGRYQLTMENTASEPPPGFATLALSGEFSLDLKAARRDGMIRYEGCEPAPFAITNIYPEDGAEHVAVPRPPVKVVFDSRLDPATIDTDRFQLTVPAPDTGTLTPIPGRLLRDATRAFFVPDAPLQGGVRYTARVKTGDDGVRSAAGEPLEDADGSGWYSWTFASAIDFGANDGNPARQLACNLFQTVRDAPLIEGKPTVVRVGASWPRPVGVHPRAHVNSFEAEVVVWNRQATELASTTHTFVRPDLWDSRNISTRKAQHTAQLYGLKPTAADELYRAGLRIRTPYGNRLIQYTATCPTQHWPLAPVLTAEYFVLRIGEWANDPAALARDLPHIDGIIGGFEKNALELLPIAELRRTGGPRVLDVPSEIGQPGPDDGAGAVVARVKDWLATLSDADVIVAFGPHAQLGGGGTGRALAEGQGIFVTPVSEEVAFLPRYVNAAVHELGHVLGLEHSPDVRDTVDRERATSLREGSAPILFAGIEGFRLSRDGSVGWNKSSTEGNEQGSWLVTLMFPGTIQTDDAFITNRDYREVQRLFESLNWPRNVTK
jgi:hypothetical protein